MMFLEHLAPLFDELDGIVSRLMTLAVSIGALVAAVMAIRAKLQNVAADRIVGEIEDEHAQAPMGGMVKKARAVEAMRSAGVLVRPSLKRAAKLIQAKVDERNAARNGK